MPSGAMRFLGRTTRTQLVVLGAVLIVLGAVGAAMVISLPNEDPGSPLVAPAKDKYYRNVSFWAVFGLLVILVVGLVLVGTALTGIPAVDMARNHVGVFYCALFALLLIPGAVVARMGALLRSGATYDEKFVSAFADISYSSPAGSVALWIGLITVGLSLALLALNALELARVSYRPREMRTATVVALAMTGVTIVALVLLPFMPAVNFEYREGRITAVGFETFDPQQVSISMGTLSWLGKGETRSTYGALSTWMVLSTWMLFFALVAGTLTFIGIALYCANDRSRLAFQLMLMPIAVAALAALATLAFLGLNGSVTQLSSRNSVTSDVTNIAYVAGPIYLMVGLAIAVLALGAAAVVPFKAWIRSMTMGEELSEPLSMQSYVDPPTGMPPSHLGWPVRWEAMTTANYAVVGVAAIVFLAGMVSGFYVKRDEAASGGSPLADTEPSFELVKLSDDRRLFYFNETATEGADPTPLQWMAGGVWFVKSIELSVKWTDELPTYSFTNDPDVFVATVNTSMGDERLVQGSNEPSTGNGELRLRMEFKDYVLTTDPVGFRMPSGAVQGDINVTVKCLDAGDQRGRLGFLTIPDTGNAYSAVLTVNFKYYEAD